jgi:rod shape-determining protein MreC
LTAGGDRIFPRGLPVGEGQKVVRDPDRDAFIDVIVKPYAHLDRLDEVLVITAMEPRFSPEQQQDLAASEAVMGAEAAALKDQLKASQLMAERLPGLIDPNLPPEQQPLLDSSNPESMAHPPQPYHPDRFSPGMAPGTATTNNGTQVNAPAKPETANPQRNP